MASEFPVLTAWLMSDSATDDVAMRHILIQPEVNDDGERTGALVAIASVGEEDYLASEPSDDMVGALDSLDDLVASEAGRLMRAESRRVETDDDEEEVDDED